MEQGKSLREEPIFALDIGTHDIIGIVGVSQEGSFQVLAVARMDYTHRAMRDGQIEDIEQVAATADRVRRQLERKLGLRLENVHVAAAGRALKTQATSFEAAAESNQAIEQQQIADLENCAIQQAEEQLLSEKTDADVPLYYIGHSVTHYYLDDYPISTLLGHRGKKIKADIIATFLPGEVVESLYAAMRSIGISIHSITLEPIAAMNAIIPSELRLLNLALVDIGAGTSDIAVSAEGSVIAYTMATIAGDEITEAIVREFLVDFETAEQMKLSLSQDMEQIPYRDILNFEYSVAPALLREKIQPALENLCDEICSRILEVNGKPPAAVFLVGGGSKLGALCSMVAKGLSMEKNRVAVGGNNYMRKLVSSEIDVSGPEYATPMGIALTAANGQSIGRYTVKLNRHAVSLFRQGRSTVMELLRMNGYDQNQLLGKSGKSITFELDGRTRVIRGSRQMAAVLTVNGQPAGLTTELHPNDSIEAIPAVSGVDAHVTAAEVVEDYHVFEITVDGKPRKAGTVVLVNGERVAGDRLIADQDCVQTRQLDRISELWDEMGLDPADGWTFSVNGKPCGAEERLREGDAVTLLRRAEKPAPEGSAVVQEKPMRVCLNGKELLLPGRPKDTPYQFVDMLNYVEIDPAKPEGEIALLLNGQDTSYLAEIHEGDSIDIYWNK